MTAFWEQIARHISDTRGQNFAPRAPKSIGGGCINQAIRLADEQDAYFIKLNSASLLHMFEAEQAGLTEIADGKTIRVPHPLCSGTLGNQAFLVMEYIDLAGGKPGSAKLAGRQLAAMHRVTREQYGWDRDNTIGSTLQPNKRHEDWITFWQDQRLGFQLAEAARNGYVGALQRQGERLLNSFPALLDHGPAASLLHGDLWGGNLSYDRQGNPVIYDPAVYYGDREADLAMTELFGGFGRDFYAAYSEAWPLDAGYTVRKAFYNLYHILNHLNLFGGGYLGQAENMIDRLLAELG